MNFTEKLLAWTGFALIAATLTGAPWLFGAWEMWHFWPFAFCVFLAAFLLALRFLLRARPTPPEAKRSGAGFVIDVSPDPAAPATAHFSGVRRRIVVAVLAMLPFLVYAFARAWQAPVRMDAERSFLLHLTPFLVGLHIVFGFDRRQRSALFAIVAINLCALGLYGVFNHIFVEFPRVLWRQGFEQYAGRATGSFFCPDHFAGVMELAVCIGLAWLTARERQLPWKLWGVAMIGLGTVGVILSHSRGGGLTLIVIFACALIWGLGQWPPRRRWTIGLATLGALALALIVFWNSGHAYVTRFKEYGAWRRIGQVTEESGWKTVAEDAGRTSRGRMYAGAWRAWRSAPVFGIGPGMHQHLWFHYGPSPDGNRETGIWPTLRNTDFHSFEVHSDWLQLLEEYGIVGFLLFLGPAIALFLLLLGGLRRESRRRRKEDWDDAPGERHDLRLAGLLAWIAMAFHSLGDFNLQMPATAWLLAALLALALRTTSASARTRR